MKPVEQYILVLQFGRNIVATEGKYILYKMKAYVDIILKATNGKNTGRLRIQRSQRQVRVLLGY